ncbi:MAG TPA: F0F1 ATP synthase subunit A [Chitinophagaceae bacterium]|nr:F0F1 ATP synthase subunit A [Chitinophagaceae bacterium]
MVKSTKSILAAVFSVFSVLFFNTSFAQEKHEEKPKIENTEKKDFDANEVIFGHVLDAHEFHFLSYKGDDGEEHHATIPLPVILFSKEKGFDVFMSSKFHHGEHDHKDYRLLTNEKIAEDKLDPEKYAAEQIVAVNEKGEIDNNIKVYDISLTRNVVQMLIALTLLVLIMVYMAKKYRTGQGVSTAPKGIQNLIEPIITFVRDEVAKPSLGHKYKKYFPYLLTIFFFILVNNLVGLIPGTANVTGNIAFTMVLSVISFIVIIFSTNKHYWAHIFNPPVPLGIKPILIPVEILGVFTKPFALMIRLFANMIAGHIIIICLISLIFIFGALSASIGWGFSPLSIAFVVFIYLIEILVAFLQAYIFTNLTAVFIGQAFEGGHSDVDHQEDAVIV